MVVGGGKYSYLSLEYPLASSRRRGNDQASEGKKDVEKSRGLTLSVPSASLLDGRASSRSTLVLIIS